MGTADDFLDRYAALPSAERNSAGVRPPSASLRLSVLYRPIQPPSSSMKRAGVQSDQSLPCQNSFLSRPKKPSIAALSGPQPLADWIGYTDVDGSGRGARDGRAVYAFLREGRGEGLPGYGAFTAWCRAHDVPFGGAGGREPHPRFETPPGRQLQFDWKEGMRLVDSEGEAFEFSVFTATLGYSRKHRFIPVRSRTLDDLLSCLLATFTRLGGVPEECITDNMSCLVTVSGRRRTRQERAWRFAREAGFC